jgi:hypothetical protein
LEQAGSLDAADRGRVRGLADAVRRVPDGVASAHVSAVALEDDLLPRAVGRVETAGLEGVGAPRGILHGAGRLAVVLGNGVPCPAVGHGETVGLEGVAVPGGTLHGAGRLEVDLGNGVSCPSEVHPGFVARIYPGSVQCEARAHLRDGVRRVGLWCDHPAIFPGLRVNLPRRDVRAVPGVEEAGDGIHPQIFCRRCFGPVS